MADLFKPKKGLSAVSLIFAWVVSYFRSHPIHLWIISAAVGRRYSLMASIFPQLSLFAPPFLPVLSSGYANGIIGPGMYSNHHVTGSDSSDTLRIAFSQYWWVKNLSDDIYHWRCFKVINRIYGSDVPSNYSRLVSSLLFAGTVLGMISFGYISDRLGRKFGMVSWIITGASFVMFVCARVEVRSFLTNVLWAGW